MKKKIIISITVCVMLVACILLIITSVTPFLSRKIKLDDDMKISSFYVWKDTGSYKRKIQTLSTMLDGRDYLYRFVILDDDVERFPSDISMVIGLGVPSIKYRVKILDDYGADTGLVGHEFIITNLTHPQLQVYRMPRMLKNNEYLMISEGPSVFNSPSTPHGGVYFMIDDIDGTEYVYPYIVDCSSLDNAIEITDLEESMIYKHDTDWDVIEYIEEHDLDMPYFAAKFEIDDFVNQVVLEQRKRRS